MEGFTVALALVDAAPVLLFCASMALVSARFGSPLFALGAALCIVGGVCKVLWKLLLGLHKGDVKPLNRLFAPCMATGFLMMLAAVVINHKRISLAAVWADVTAFPAALFFAVALIALIAMLILSRRFKRTDAGANWRAQIVNTVMQLALLLGILSIR